MYNRFFGKLAAVALLALATGLMMNTGAHAQVLKKLLPQHAGPQESGNVQPKMYIAPGGGQPGYGPQPRLGFHGHMIHGFGMRVDHVLYGTPAQQAGLEGGDVIWSINGRRIFSRFDYDSALQTAAMYQGGWVTLTVRNVRYDTGMSSQQFVNVTVRVMGGYALSVAGAALGGDQPYPAGAAGSALKSAASAADAGSASTESGDF